MKLQLALDHFNIQEATNLLKEVADVIDIVEVGTPFIIKEGLKAAEEIKTGFPHLEVLADLKIMDAGMYEASMAYEAGADIVTVLGVSDDETIKGVVAAASKYNRLVMADMICVKNLAQRAAEVENTGVDYVCVHTASDLHAKGKNPLKDLRKIKSSLKKVGIAVAGGINKAMLESILQENPEIIIVGTGITGQKDRRETALAMKKMINEYRRS